MRVSVQGICSILSHEGVILSTYDDGGGVLTIGAGHTAMAGPPIPVSGMKISLPEAFNIFRRDLGKYEQQVIDAIHVPLSQHQFDALVSWHFNTGRINNSTLSDKLNDSDYDGAAKEFARWKKDNGKVVQGLVNRRKAETAIFVSGSYGDSTVNVRSTKGGKVTAMDSAEIVQAMTGAPTSEEDQSTQELLRNPNSRLLPKFRPQQTAETSLAALQKFEKLIPGGRRDDQVKLLAVRGYYTDTLGKVGQNDRGLYDDAIFVIEPNGVHSFNGNTDPSVFRKGIAKLKAPQAVRYIPGPHGFKRKNGPYPAFRQNSSCVVTRDQKGDDKGIFWINLHRGGVTQTSSAGCQTVPPHQWDEFRTLINNLLDQYNQNTFYYVLIDEDDVPEVVPAQPDASTVIHEHSDKDKIMSDSRQKELLEVVTTIVQLSDRIRQLRNGKSEGAADSPSDKKTDVDDVLKSLLGTLTGEPVNPPKPEPQPEELTPVNAALGDTIGRALDGRKTGLGIIGLLGATVLPIFFPQLEPAVAAAKSVIGAVGDAGAGTDGMTTGQSIIAAAKPLFISLTGWGGLGKIEKWINKIKG
ncbi:MAG: lysozyme [Rhizobiaceae bacterium]